MEEVDDLYEDESGTEPRDVDDASDGSRLGNLASSWQDIQQLRIRLWQRGFKNDIAKALLEEKKYIGRNGKETTKRVGLEIEVGQWLVRELSLQPIWPWLVEHHYPRGVYVARLVALIRDPRRFPGQPCSAPRRHYSPPLYAVGSPCPVLIREKNKDGKKVENPCGASLLAPRPHTGVASLHHYLGLHVVDGHSPRRKSGQKADWSTIGKTICLGDRGIADQIVLHRGLHQPKSKKPCRLGEDCPMWQLGLIYDANYARLVAERGIEAVGEHDGADDPAQTEGAEAVVETEFPCGSLRSITRGRRADVTTESDSTRCVYDHGPGLKPLKPHEIDAIARKIAVKAFVADLLTEMKRLAA